MNGARYSMWARTPRGRQIERFFDTLADFNRYARTLPDNTVVTLDSRTGTRQEAYHDGRGYGVRQVSTWEPYAKYVIVDGKPRKK